MLPYTTLDYNSLRIAPSMYGIRIIAQHNVIVVTHHSVSVYFHCKVLSEKQQLFFYPGTPVFITTLRYGIFSTQPGPSNTARYDVVELWRFRIHQE